MIPAIDSLQSYVGEISRLNNEKSKECTRCSYEYLFRGQSDLKYQLLPNIARYRNTSCDRSIFNGERNLISLAKFKFPDIFKDEMKPLELLAILQHYGIPTRLLDLTENALVALFFACCSNHDADGEVFVFINEKRNVAIPPVADAIADSYRLTEGAPCKLEIFYRAALNQPYFIEQKHILRKGNEKAEAEAFIEGCCKKVCFVHAPIHTLRQRIQGSRFILFPNRIIDNHLKYEKAFDTIIDPISKDDECIKTRLVIKKESKESILRDLETCGISNSTLFADSIDEVCKGIVNDVVNML